MRQGGWVSLTAGPGSSLRCYEIPCTCRREINGTDCTEQAWEFFRRTDLHKLSAVDPTSFAIMKRERIRLAYAFDHHFAAVGFSWSLNVRRKIAKCMQWLTVTLCAFSPRVCPVEKAQRYLHVFAGS